MGAEICDVLGAAVRARERVLGFDLSKTLFEGTEDAVGRTDVCKRILTVTLAIARRWTRARTAKPWTPTHVAGLSLCEYSVARRRGTLTFEKTPSVRPPRPVHAGGVRRHASRHGGVMGIETDAVEEAGAEIRACRGVSSSATSTSPGPGPVVSGEKNALARCRRGAERRRRQALHPVEGRGAFHSRVMQPAPNRRDRGDDVQGPARPGGVNVTRQR